MASGGSSSSSPKTPEITINTDTDNSNDASQGNPQPKSNGAGDQKTPSLHVDTSVGPQGHGHSSPPKSRGTDTSNRHLEVPGSARDRQSSVDTAIPSPTDTSGLPSNATTLDNSRHGPREDIMNDEDALKPDQGMEAAFEVENNPFAFSPGQLSKMFDPKSLSAFYKLGGLGGLEAGLRTDRKNGLDNSETALTGSVGFEEATSSANGKVDNRVTTNGHAGEKGDSFQDRLRVFKDNRIPARKGKSLLALMWIALQDKVLIMLSIAAVISLAIGIYQSVGTKHDPDDPNVEWVEGVAIVVAIMVVVLVSALVDWSKEYRFAKLNRKKEDRYVKAIRSGETAEISIYSIMAGDVIRLEPGDVVPADGVLIEGFGIKCDESQATGESDLIRKRAADDVFQAIKDHEDLKRMDPFIQSGAQITEGMGSYLVTATGVNSSYGKIMMALNDEQDMTPLQHKLNRIALWIAKFGMSAAGLLFVVLFIKFCINLSNDDSTPADKAQKFLDIVIVIVTIVVVAVPEGLPLAVTLALAYAMVRMLQDKNLVRHLKACEVMGNATSICSDKTGTLTQNEMRVVSGTIGTEYQFGGRQQESEGQDNNQDQPPSEDTYSPEVCISKIHSEVRDILINSIALNSTAFEAEQDGQTKFNGSKTESALLLLARDYMGLGPVKQYREGFKSLQLLPFDSGRKAMGVVIELPDGGARLYVKGASEIILSNCTHLLSDISEGIKVSELTDESKSFVSNLIDTYARRSLRTIGLAYRDFGSWPPRDAPRVAGNPNEVDVAGLFRDLVFVGMVGIQDPLRPGVADSVALCQKAGVTVRMVTGDNKLTAQAIARECGILQGDGVVMEGPEFRNLSRARQEEIIPRLQVLARSSPEDKRVLVKRLKEKDEIVAVTGDGTNDAPALTTADVGFSMGQAGTEVAKEASAIILMDDNFVSIVQALKWGRAVNDSVKKFLQFQLTVNITAVALTFVTAVSDDDESSVLTAVQLLWVNLIMDTLAALALATDPPQDSILDRLPEPRKNFIVTPTMWKMIIGQALYQLIVTFGIYYGKGNVLPGMRNIGEKQLNTLVFNTFVWMQIFNQWNNRRLDNRFNIFEGILRNPYMMGIGAFLCGAQVLIMFVGGAAFSVDSEFAHTPESWAVALIMGFLSIPIGMLIRCIPDSFIERTMAAVWSAIPEFLRRRLETSPDVKVSDEEIGLVPDPLLEVRDELKFIRRMRGGRLKNLKFAMQHPKMAVAEMQRSRSPSRTRSESVQPQTPMSDERPGSATTMDSRRRSSNPFRGRSNSTLGATVVMAGIVAGGPAAGWSPAEDRPDSSKGPGAMETVSRQNNGNHDE